MAYGCHNHPEDPRRTGMRAQLGWTEDGRRNMVPVETQWIELQCGHDFSDKDRDCDDCRWQKKPDAQV
jgi:hypothetical protein